MASFAAVISAICVCSESASPLAVVAAFLTAVFNFVSASAIFVISPDAMASFKFETAVATVVSDFANALTSGVKSFFVTAATTASV